MGCLQIAMTIAVGAGGVMRPVTLPAQYLCLLGGRSPGVQATGLVEPSFPSVASDAYVALPRTNGLPAGGLHTEHPTCLAGVLAPLLQRSDFGRGKGEGMSDVEGSHSAAQA